jgi:hypothetical protein
MLRVLALHGYAQNAAWLMEHTTLLREHFKDKIEFGSQCSHGVMV